MLRKCLPCSSAPRLRTCRISVGYVGLFLAVHVGCERTADTSTREMVTVLAAASTTNAVEQIAQLFESKNARIELQVSTGPSNGLAQQILSGAPADLFLSANRKWADAIIEADLASETIDLLTNRLVLIVPQGNPAGINEPSDLQSASVSRVAIAGENVPAGIYAQAALRSLKLFSPLEQANKLARGADVRITLTYVERAEAEAGIVYATDARISDRVKVVTELDAGTYEPIVYPAVLLKSASNNAAPRKFFRFLQSAEARSIFVQSGFTPLASEP